MKRNNKYEQIGDDGHIGKCKQGQFYRRVALVAKHFICHSIYITIIFTLPFIIYLLQYLILQCIIYTIILFNQLNNQRMFSYGGKANNFKPIKINYKQQKQSLNYVPKLVPFILADSNVTEQNSSSPVSNSKKDKLSSKDSFAFEQQSYKKQCHDRKQARVDDSLSILSKFPIKIRYSVQCFLSSINQQKQMSPLLQLAIQNLLMNVLNIANSLQNEIVAINDSKLNTLNKKPLTQSINRQNPNFQKSKTNKIIQNFIKIQQCQHYPFEQSKYNDKNQFDDIFKIKKKGNNIQITNDDYLRKLKQISSYQIFKSVLKEQKSFNSYLQDASEQSSSLNTKNDYCTIKQTNSYQEQSLDEIKYQIQSEIQIQQSALCTRNLPQREPKNKNYYSNYMSDKSQNLNKNKNKCINQEMSKGKTDQINISISQYYVQSSSESSYQIENKQNNSLTNIKEFKIYDSIKSQPHQSQISNKKKNHIESQVLSRRKFF